MLRSALSLTMLILVLSPLAQPVWAQETKQTDSKAYSEKELAEALAQLKKKTDRYALLKKKKALQTPQLVQELNKIGIKFFTAEAYPAALDVFNLGLDIATQIGDKTGTAQILDNIGSTHYATARHSLALSFYYRSLELRRDLKNKSLIARTLNNIANVLHARGDYVGALKNYQESLALFDELKQTEIADKVLNNIGIVYQDQGDYDLALKHYRLSLERKQAIEETLQDKGSIAKTYNNIGSLFADQGDYIQALDAFGKSKALYESLTEGKEAGLAAVFINTGVLHQYLGNYDLALSIFEQSLKYSIQADDPEGVGGALNNIGSVLDALGQYTRAEKQFRKSIRHHQRLGLKTGEVGSRYNLAGNLYLQKKYKAALKNYRLSLRGYRDLGDKDGIASTLVNLAEVHRALKNFPSTFRLNREAVALAREIEAPHTLWSALTNQGISYRAMKKPLLARESLTEAINIIESLWSRTVKREQDRQAFFETNIAPYHELVDLLIEQKDTAEALKYAEQAKGRILLDVIKSGKINVSEAMSASEREQENDLLKQLTSLNAEILFEQRRPQVDAARLRELVAQRLAARRSYELFQTNLYARYDDLRQRRGAIPALNEAQLKQLLPDNKHVLVEYLVTEDVTYLFVITRGATESSGLDRKVYRLEIHRDDLRKRVGSFLDQITQRKPEISESAEGLYRLLLGTAHDLMVDKKKITIVPDDALWTLPFEALKPNSENYLVGSSAVSYAPSLTILWEMSFGQKQGTTTSPTGFLLGIGNPAIAGSVTERITSLRNSDETDLGSIPYAETEVRALESLYGKDQCKLFIGPEAREDEIKKEIANYRILHFATHSLLNNSSPMYSNMVLATPQSGSEDGLLEAWEILNMNLSAEMAVLSACETGRGRAAPGEGIIGVSWAFFVANCPTTVVSQWKVADVSTADFMERFHGNLKKGMSKSEALQEAKIWMISYSYHTDESGRVTRHSHPFYWAPFILVGRE